VNLVESIKNLRKKISDVTIAKADWDFYPGEDLPSITDVGKFLDKKLIDFCSDKQFLYGSMSPRTMQTENDRVSVDRNNDRRINSELKHTVIRIPNCDKNTTKGKSAFIASYDLYVIPIKETNRFSISMKARIAISSDPTISLSGTDWLNDTTPREKIIESIKSNLVILSKNRANSIAIDTKNPEYNALMTLREMISETDFRKYLKYGFLNVNGKNGRVYQIFRDKSHTKVFENGRLKEEICVRLTTGVPYTDNVIAFKVMIETSEDLFRSSGNIYRITHYEGVK
jgi:hypothetical protein